MKRIVKKISGILTFIIILAGLAGCAITHLPALPVEETSKQAMTHATEPTQMTQESQTGEPTQEPQTEEPTQPATDSETTGMDNGVEASSEEDHTIEVVTAKPQESTSEPAQVPTEPVSLWPLQPGYVGLVGKTIYDYDLYLHNWDAQYTELGFTEDGLRRIDELIGEIIDDGMTSIEKIRSVHDYIVANVEYDYSNSHCSVDDVLFCKKSICQGYADTFYVFMTELGIPCHTFSGDVRHEDGHMGGHAWNAVQIENGEWYFIDSTWDDGAGKISYRYFMATADTIGINHFVRYSRQNPEITDVLQLGILGTDENIRLTAIEESYR